MCLIIGQIQFQFCVSVRLLVVMKLVGAVLVTSLPLKQQTVVQAWRDLCFTPPQHWLVIPTDLSPPSLLFGDDGSEVPWPLGQISRCNLLLRVQRANGNAKKGNRWSDPLVIVFRLWRYSGALKNFFRFVRQRNFNYTLSFNHCICALFSVRGTPHPKWH